MAGVGNHDGTSTSAVGSIDQLTAIACLRDNAFDRSGLRADDSNDLICGDAIAKSDVDELHSLCICWDLLTFIFWCFLWVFMDAWYLEILVF